MKYEYIMKNIFNMASDDVKDEVRKVSYQIDLIVDTAYQFYLDEEVEGLKNELNIIFRDVKNEFLTLNEFRQKGGC